MTRTLTLIRHAKSSWKDATLKDFERPLNKRGRHNAPLMGGVIQRSGLSFDRMVSSPAERAITTARLIAAELGYPEQQIQTLDELYDASAEQRKASGETSYQVFRNIDDPNTVTVISQQQSAEKPCQP